MNRIASRIALLLALGMFSIAQDAAWAQTANTTGAKSTTGPSEIKIGGAVTTPIIVSLADAKAMPRKTLRVTDSHNNQTQVYEGVPLDALLAKAGAPTGENIRGPLLAAFVMVEAADGYRVLFSLPELDSGFLDSDILVADTLNGAALGANQGPFKLVAPYEKGRHGVVRMVKSITVVRVPENQNP